MQLCSDAHIEICYEDGNACPLCEALSKNKELESDLDSETEERKKAERECGEAQDELEKLKSGQEPTNP